MNVGFIGVIEESKFWGHISDATVQTDVCSKN
jgi:hypothetical protein